MTDLSIIYKNGRGEVKHYAVTEKKRDHTHVHAIHDGRLKTFRLDSILEELRPDDDADSHLAFWQDQEFEPRAPKARKTPPSVRAKTRSSRPRSDDAPDADSGVQKPSAIPFPDRGQPADDSVVAKEKQKSRHQKPKAAKRPIQWRDFWFGFAAAWALVVVIAVLAG